MKRLIAGIMILLVASGCTTGSGYTILSYENNSSTSMQMSYEKFTGTRETSFKVKKDKEIEARVSIVTEAGSISLSVTDEEGNSEYQSDHMTDSQMFVVNLTEAGRYKIKVESTDHKGSYRINWGD